MKNTRQERILRLIREHDIGTQEELASYLARDGVSVTQATISRDIRELNLRKVPVSGGKMKYVAGGDQQASPGDAGRYKRMLRSSYLSMDISANILVIHTASGMAMACATALDGLAFPEILGSIAGDDTVIAVIAENADPAEVRRRIEDAVK